MVATDTLAMVMSSTTMKVAAASIDGAEPALGAGERRWRRSWASALTGARR